MNVAFSAIVALVLILPGLIFLNAVLRSGLNYPVTPQPLSSEAVVVFFAAAISHAGWYGVLRACGILKTDGLDVNPTAVVEFLCGKFPKDDPSSALAAISDYPFHVLGYMIGVCVLAALFGMVLGRWSDEFLGKTGLLQPRGARAREWNVFFQVLEDPYSVALVTAVVELGGAAWLYVGILDKLCFDPETGGLDRLILVEVYRRIITQEEDKKETAANGPMDNFYSIAGDFFILRYSEIKTLNVKYVKFNEASA